MRWFSFTWSIVPSLLLSQILVAQKAPAVLQIPVAPNVAIERNAQDRVHGDIAAIQANTQMHVAAIENVLNAPPPPPPPANADISDIRASFSKLQERVVALEQLNQQRTSLNANLLKSRYKTGYILLSEMEKKAKNIDLTISTVKIATEFGVLTNPEKDPNFTKLLGEIQSTQGDSNKLDLPAAFTANPYVSLAFSVASIFTSHSHKDVKAAHLVGIACTLDIASRGFSDEQILSTEEQRLIDNITNFEHSIESGFNDYTKILGYARTLGEYQKDNDSCGCESLDSIVNDAVSKSPAALTKSMQYQIELVRSRIAEYNQLVSQVRDFYDHFGATVDSYITPKDANCSASTTAFQPLKKEAVDLQQKFMQNDWKLPSRSLSDLYATE